MKREREPNVDQLAICQAALLDEGHVLTRQATAKRRLSGFGQRDLVGHRALRYSAAVAQRHARPCRPTSTNGRLFGERKGALT